MSTAALEILKNNLSELNLGFTLSNIETFLHEQSRMEKPLIEILCDLFDHELTQRRQRAAKTRLKLSRLPSIKYIDDFKIDEVEGITQKKLAQLCGLSFYRALRQRGAYGTFGTGKDTHSVGSGL